MKNEKIAIILGTRPEIIKMSPIIRECEIRKLDYFILHSNQHYSPNLDKVFFEELNLPLPKHNLKVGSGSQGEQTGKMLISMEKVLEQERPNVVLVQGDTNTVLAGALSASKLQINVGHVEAGLRSYYREMPEEINRVLTDHASDYLFAPTEQAKDILLKENVYGEVIVTGNTIVDAVHQNLELAQEKSVILNKLGMKEKKFILLTAHRQENVDYKDRLKGILEGVDKVVKHFGLPVVYPIHPRAKKMLKKFNLQVPAGVEIIEPLGYLDFLNLQSKAKLILTDSGGVQEEACILGVPCVTLRNNTERPETIEVGSNILAGRNPDKILDSSLRMFEKETVWKNPFGKGIAGKEILKYLHKQ